MFLNRDGLHISETFNQQIYNIQWSVTISKSDDKENEYIPRRNFSKGNPISAPKGAQGKKKTDWGNLKYFTEFAMASWSP